MPTSLRRSGSARSTRIEKLTFLAAGGHLTEREIARIAADGRKAKARIGTTSEHQAHQSPHYGGDKLRAALADAVQAALKS
jgi:hypothetical protein